jgi:hypothetical protein
LVRDPAVLRDLGAAGLAHARGFTWEQCAERTHAVYREALDR